MDAIKNITQRNSARELIEPHPSNDEMKIVYEAALRAPDHAWLRPSKFIQVSGKKREELSKIFLKTAKELKGDLTDLQIDKYKKAPFRSPMIVILISTPKDHPKVPAIEQIISTACAGENILLSLNALGYGAIWRTGTFAFNKVISKYLNLDDSSEVIGYIYTGTSTGDNKSIPQLNIDDYVNVWE